MQINMLNICIQLISRPLEIQTHICTIRNCYVENIKKTVWSSVLDHQLFLANVAPVTEYVFANIRAIVCDPKMINANAVARDEIESEP